MHCGDARALEWGVFEAPAGMTLSAAARVVRAVGFFSEKWVPSCRRAPVRQTEVAAARKSAAVNFLLCRELDARFNIVS